LKVAGRVFSLADARDFFGSSDYGDFSVQQTADIRCFERQSMIASILSLYKTVGDETGAPQASSEQLIS